VTTATATDRVPCAPLAEAFERSDLTAYDVCQRMGWTNVNRRQASTKVRRALGLKQSKNGSGDWRCRETMPVELAARFARVFDVELAEAGL